MSKLPGRIIVNHGSVEVGIFSVLCLSDRETEQWTLLCFSWLPPFLTHSSVLVPCTPLSLGIFCLNCVSHLICSFLTSILRLLWYRWSRVRGDSDSIRACGREPPKDNHLKGQGMRGHPRVNPQRSLLRLMASLTSPQKNVPQSVYRAGHYGPARGLKPEGKVRWESLFFFFFLVKALFRTLL